VAGADWIDAWWAWTVAATLQGSLLLACAWLADRALVRRAWPQLLTLSWLLALARFFLPPQLGSPLSLTSALGAPTLALAELRPHTGAPTLLCALWAAGAASLIALRAARRARLRARLEPVALSPAWRAALARCADRLALARVPRVAALRGLETAAVFGLRDARVLVPRTWLAREPGPRDEHALLHELAHLARRDLALDELAALVRALLWFHPLAWVAARRLHDLSELACDETVARVLGRDARSYRETLILAARPQLTRAPASGLRGFLGSPSAIVLRIERLGHASPPSTLLVRAGCTAFAAALGACIVPMAPRAAELSAALRTELRADLHSRARAAFAAAQRGEPQSCFTLQAAALVLADASHPNVPPSP
jgi:beta-lactamase regulating signal transducer with metallopeptidase domain